MESAAINGARWVLGKALSPLSGGLVEGWAATKELEPNIEALKTELLYAQAMLENARGTEIRSHALGELLQKLRRLAYSSEDVLDELDYFRIQDELESTFEAVDDDRGCARNLVRDVRHVATAAAKQLGCASLLSTNDQADEESCKCVRRISSGARTAAKQLCCASCLLAARGSDEESDGEPSKCGRRLASRVRTTAHAAKQLCCASRSSGSENETCNCKCVRRLASRARTTAHAFGKRLLCSSPLSVRDDSKHAPRIPKLKFDRVDVSTRMKSIADELKPLCAKVSTILGLELSGSVISELRLGSSRGIGNAAHSSRPITTSHVLEPRVYGRDPQKNTIVEYITKGEYIHRDLTVIPIVGPGGIGKTTFTQCIYNSETVQAHFQIRVWACVSLDFNVYKLTQEIVNSIPKAEDEKNDRTNNEVQNLDQLQILIEKRLKNRRFLLVLDDIWKYGNEDEWHRFLVPFKKVQGNGDTVLVTTRFLEVAEMVRKGDKLLQLEGLEPTEYWELFLACVFEGTNQHTNLFEIGKKIVEKLKGSPLAAKTVGKLLRHDLTVDHWTRVLESKEWESQTSDHDIMPALKLSYDYLPFHLQQCFSSCALFPEDYEFECEELIHFWIGLDILHLGHRTKIIEDIGRDNLDDLVNYGFFKKETSDSGTHYVMHDLLHDLALNVCSQECLHIGSSSPRAVDIAPSVYHLSISITETADSEEGVLKEKFRKELDKIRNIIKFENLRTFMLFGKYDSNFVRIFGDLLKNTKSLRVVFLSTMDYPVESLLYNFSNLVHLRYLRLVSEFSNKERLPRNISRFYQLRVLDIRRLHDFHGPLGDMTNLVKLRHFLPCNKEHHSNICNVGKLPSLQELRRFEVRKENIGFELKELGQLEELGGSLDICNLENALVNEAHEAKLLHKNRLQKLSLNWEKGWSNKNPESEDQVLESLRPHSNLHELSIHGHGGFTCPTWLGTTLSTKGLEALSLDSIDWESFPSLGELYLIRDSGEEYLSCTTGPSFHNLKRLELIGLPRFRRWVANEFCPWYFSLIEVLVVEDCPELTELPFSSYTTCCPSERDLNVTWFPLLTKIEIRNCPKLLSLPPTPYSQTICNVTLGHVGRGLKQLFYSSMSSYLSIEGNDALLKLDDTVLAFHNLTQLKELSIKKCPPLAEEHLRMLTSLNILVIRDSTNIFQPLARSDVEWQLPVNRLIIQRCGCSGKELTRLLSHLPGLSSLDITECEKITGLGVEAKLQQTAASLSLPACSAVKLQDARATDQQQEIAQEVEEEVVADQEDGGGLLLLPAHLSDSLQQLSICDSRELILTAHNNGVGGGGLPAMRSLQALRIEDCPKFLSAYTASGLSSCCPFPSSLRDLTLIGHMEGMETLVSLSNLTSLHVLRVLNWGEELRHEGLLPLLTQGQLTTLEVKRSPKFFAGWDPARGLQGEPEQLSSKLHDLQTDDIAGVLTAPICSFLSSSLTNLSLESVNEVEHFTKEQEEALTLLTSLHELRFWYCEKLRCLPTGLHKLTNLKILKIWNCPAIRSLPKNGLPSSLQELDVEGCNNLQCLPAGLHKLTNLKILEIWSCPAIRSLPKNGLPSSLQELDVRFCSNEELKQRCRQLMGTIPKNHAID